MNIHPDDVVSKDVLKSFRNLLQSGDGTCAERLVEDLDILWASVKVVKRWFQHWFDSWCMSSIANILPAITGKCADMEGEGNHPIKKSSAKHKFLLPMERRIFMGGLDRTRKERSFWTQSKEPNASFSVGYISSPKGRDKKRHKVDLKHLAVTRNCVYGQHSIRSSWLFSGRCINNQHVCI